MLKISECLACLLMLAVLSTYADPQLTKKDNKIILRKHNKLRRGVAPTASNMEKMFFNSELATVAQNYADRCIWRHNDDRSAQSDTYAYVGENLYITTSPDNDYEAAVQSWYDEVKDYDYDTGKCTPGEVCGHYTQVVWATSTNIGCGAKRCPTVEGLPTFRDALLVVCNYGPGGNIDEQKPYKSGVPCDECPESAPKCKKNLCKPKKKLMDILMGIIEED